MDWPTRIVLAVLGGLLCWLSGYWTACWRWRTAYRKAVRERDDAQAGALRLNAELRQTKAALSVLRHLEQARQATE